MGISDLGVTVLDVDVNQLRGDFETVACRLGGTGEEGKKETENKEHPYVARFAVGLSLVQLMLAVEFLHLRVSGRLSGQVRSPRIPV